MRLPAAKVLIAGVIGAGSLFFLGELGLARYSGSERSLTATQAAKITIDYPLEGSVFPPEITAPTFLWHDSSETANRWVVEVSFGHHAAAIRVEAAGEHMQFGEVDSEAGAGTEASQLTPEQAAMRTWKPDADTWTKIKTRNREIAGNRHDQRVLGRQLENSGVGRQGYNYYVERSCRRPYLLSRCPTDAVPHTEKGSIQPLPTSALPLIKWRLRNIAEPQSQVVMENLHTCANCHSFSRDGKTTGDRCRWTKERQGLVCPGSGG